jgi:hypothetical protein
MPYTSPAPQTLAANPPQLPNLGQGSLYQIVIEGTISKDGRLRGSYNRGNVRPDVHID